MNDRLDNLAVFAKVVEAGSFAKASQQLNLTASAVSKIIARLEERLQSQLFQRTTRQQQLTEAGHTLYQHSTQILSQLQEAEAAIHQKQAPQGQLCITLPSLYGRLKIAPILSQWAAQYEDLSLQMVFSDHTEDLIQSGMDLAVRMAPLADSSSLVARPLQQQKMMVCGAPSYFTKQGKPSDFKALTEQHLGLLYGRTDYQCQWEITLPSGEKQAVSMPSQMMSNDLEVILQQALAGFGLAWLPDWLIEPYLADGQLEQALPNEYATTSDIYLVWPKSNYQPSKTRQVIETLLDAFS